MDERGTAIEVVRRWFASLERGDPSPELCDPEIEIRNWEEAPITGPYFGHDGVHQWWADVADAFDDVRFELLELTPIDDTRCLTIQPCAAGSATQASRWTAPGRRS